MSLLESLDLPIQFNEVQLSSGEFRNLINGEISNAIYHKLVQGISYCEWAKNLYLEMPSDQTLIDEEDGPIYVASEHITIKHDRKSRTWCITSWGEYLIHFLLQPIT